MAEQRLDRADVGAVLVQVRREAVSQQPERCGLRERGILANLAADLGHLRKCNGRSPTRYCRFEMKLLASNMRRPSGVRSAGRLADPSARVN